MAKYKDITGKRFGRLIAIEPVGKVKHGETTEWLCRCDCGNLTITKGQYLRGGNTKSCGCLQKELAAERMRQRETKHGECRTRLYRIWVNMKNRCNCPNNTHYECYGGRGIKVCKDWMESYENFKNWAINNGYSDTLTLDRIDVNKDYYPENCRWVTRHEQALNRRTTYQITYKGETKTFFEWSQIVGIDSKTLRSRVTERNWSVEEAFTTPLGERRRITK